MESTPLLYQNLNCCCFSKVSNAARHASGGAKAVRVLNHIVVIAEETDML